MKPHKHAEIIKAWADGAEIQYYEVDKWVDAVPTWDEDFEYRIKPEPKLDISVFCSITNIHTEEISLSLCKFDYDNLKLTFDGDTGELKSAEVLK